MSAHEGEGLAPEGVAAPLEPTREIEIMLFEMVRDFCAIGRKYRVKSEVRSRIEAYAAAVSKNLTEELARIKKLFHDLTPGGSEFYNDPDYCADYLRKRSQSQHEIAVKSIKRAKELEKEITALRETK